MATTKYLDYDGLLYLWTFIKAKFANKADKSTTTSAGSYGLSANATPAHGGNFKVPYVTVNSQGIVTGISEKTVTLPSDNNTDTLVTQNVSTANEEHPILLTVTKDASSNQGAKTSIFAAGVKVNPSTGTITATKFSGAVQGKATDADHADEADVASKVTNDLVIKVKTGTTEGTNLYTYNGSAGKTLDIKQGNNITLTAAAGSLTITGVGDTKNTAGSTDSSSKLFLIGATSQATNPQTYSHDTAYVGTDGCLYSGGTKVLTAHQSLSNYYTKTEIDTKLTSAMHYKGSVATVADLPSSNNQTGDFYNVTATGENYAWTGSEWDTTGSIVDLAAITNTEIDTIVAS